VATASSWGMIRFREYTSERLDGVFNPTTVA
jgi:hypothetical protein